MRLQLATLLLTGLCAQAQILIEQTSFGYGSPRAPGTTDIPGWKLLGEGQDIELLSDKVILTPGHPGNKRGALQISSSGQMGQRERVETFNCGMRTMDNNQLEPQAYTQ